MQEVVGSSVFCEVHVQTDEVKDDGKWSSASQLTRALSRYSSVHVLNVFSNLVLMADDTGCPFRDLCPVSTHVRMRAAMW